MKAKVKPPIQKKVRNETTPVEVKQLSNISLVKTNHIGDETIEKLVDAFIDSNYNKTKALNSVGLDNLKHNKNKMLFYDPRFLRIFLEKNVYNKLISKDILLEMSWNTIEKMEEEGDIPSGILYKLKLDYMNLVLKIIESKSLDKGEIDTIKQITFKVVR